MHRTSEIRCNAPRSIHLRCIAERELPTTYSEGEDWLPYIKKRTLCLHVYSYGLQAAISSSLFRCWRIHCSQLKPLSSVCAMQRLLERPGKGAGQGPSVLQCLCICSRLPGCSLAVFSANVAKSLSDNVGCIFHLVRINEAIPWPYYSVQQSNFVLIQQRVPLQALMHDQVRLKPGGLSRHSCIERKGGSTAHSCALLCSPAVASSKCFLVWALQAGATALPAVFRSILMKLRSPNLRCTQLHGSHLITPLLGRGNPSNGAPAGCCRLAP